MRQQGQYADLSGNAYNAAQMQHRPGQRMEHKSGNFQGRPEVMEGQWRWDRDGPEVSDPMSTQMFNKGQGGDASGSLYQRLDSKLASEKQGNSDPRSMAHEEDMDIGYESTPSSQTFEGLEQKFLDDLMKLLKEQTDAEDAENARHMEKINAINAQYQEQLGALRSRHATHRDEFLRRESQARKNQYQQAMMDSYPNSGMGLNDNHGYAGVAAPADADEPHRPYNSDNFDSYRERARFLGGARDHPYEPRGPYPGGRVYDTSVRYY